MDELFYQSPFFVPGSTWKPRSHIEEDAQKIAEEEKAEKTVHVEGLQLETMGV